MTMDENEKASEPGAEVTQLTENLARIEALSSRLVAALSHKKQIRASLQAPGPELWAKAMGAWANTLAHDPAKLMQGQLDYWADWLRHAAESTEDVRPDNMPDLPLYHVVRAQFLAARDATERALAELEGLDDKDQARVSFFAHQMLELMAPRNFLATNPEAMERAIATEGQSLIDGLDNMVRDLEAHKGELIPTLSDTEAFKVGGNIATSPGAVVFRNRMMEIIQYEARTDQVHATPLVLFPPWINKFYILDLKEKNSLVKWITEQGFTLFVVSWVNPDESYRDVGIDTYVEEGFLTAIETVKQMCGVKQVNVTGYCIGGTTLSLTLALLAKRGDKSVKSATFFTTLSDFSDPGEVGVFLDDDFVDGIEQECDEVGYLDRLFMARTFSYLRARDLVFAPAVRNYLMGEAPPAFDLLYWNGDGTNLPARMAVEYLRLLCQKNVFAGDGFALMGETLRLSDITLPLCSIACETDHIAPWKSVYQGALAMGSQDKTFILSESGHIAGIVNPPSKKKYGHYTNESWVATADEWQAGAEFTEGSWWGRWGKWLAKRSGKRVPARDLGCGDPARILAAAPGEYVTRNPE
ncbi:MAG TPA: class I poly(R)-hydroxyalkanoic acid synthase [Rhodobacterales bacterium]|nr:class I poly(R)-hydroxyalkanoic acid synthase [Rhodobacterales bacterium]